ncbi:hypothetical protein [uncultured Jannaschia sp.]|uniref:hypothetical protein n=1 Tax=uncultured Jannaschia sp. TaxID=293347 RepID=UPI0026020B3A|nr:hypothetical protein [uncultured Jannaschia sp.]
MAHTFDFPNMLSREVRIMLKTIVIGNHLSIQGTLVKMLQDGLCQVRVGTRTFTGRLVSA